MSGSRRLAVAVATLVLLGIFALGTPRKRVAQLRAKEGKMQSTIHYKKVKEDKAGSGLLSVIYAAEDSITKEPISVRQWAAMMGDKSQAAVLANDLTEIISSLPYEGLYFETPGVTSQTANKPFQMCIVDGTRLKNFAEGRASSDSFQEHLDCPSSTYSCQFTNLGGDATLIAPKKADSSLDDKTYSHLAAFLRGAPRNQVAAIWIMVGKAYRDIIETRKASNPVWLSTAGEGVPWLHFRFDSRPKYYKYATFANET